MRPLRHRAYQNPTFLAFPSGASFLSSFSEKGRKWEAQWEPKILLNSPKSGQGPPKELPDGVPEATFYQKRRP